MTRRKLTAVSREGLASVGLYFTRTTERHLPFDDRTAPQLELAFARRSGAGSCQLDYPRKSRGSSFVQDVVFRPRLAAGETVDFTVRGQMPSYKYRYQDQMLAATADVRGGTRTYEWVSRQISYPTNGSS